MKSLVEKQLKKVKIKGKNQKERLQTWYKYFQDLLGKPPNIEDENETIIQVIVRKWNTGERDESSYDEPCCLENVYCPGNNNHEISK